MARVARHLGDRRRLRRTGVARAAAGATGTSPPIHTPTAMKWSHCRMTWNQPPAAAWPPSARVYIVAAAAIPATTRAVREAIARGVPAPRRPWRPRPPRARSAAGRSDERRRARNRHADRGALGGDHARRRARDGRGARDRQQRPPGGDVAAERPEPGGRGARPRRARPAYSRTLREHAERRRRRVSRCGAAPPASARRAPVPRRTRTCPRVTWPSASETTRQRTVYDAVREVGGQRDLQLAFGRARRRPVPASTLAPLVSSTWTIESDGSGGSVNVSVTCGGRRVELRAVGGIGGLEARVRRRPRSRARARRTAPRRQQRSAGARVAHEPLPAIVERHASPSPRGSNGPWSAATNSASSVCGPGVEARESRPPARARTSWRRVCRRARGGCGRCPGVSVVLVASTIVPPGASSRRRA